MNASVGVEHHFKCHNELHGGRTGETAGLCAAETSVEGDDIAFERRLDTMSAISRCSREGNGRTMLGNQAWIRHNFQKALHGER